MSGYNYKKNMSNNAVDAYELGTKPYDEWTRAEILNEVKQIYNPDIHLFDISKLENIPLEALKMCVLSFSSWHHTTRNYKETDFYFIDGRKMLMLSNSKIKQFVTYVENKKQ